MMRHPLVAGAAAGVLMAAASIACAATNLNTSRSNNYRIFFPAGAVSAAQAAATLKALDRTGPLAGEAQLRRVLLQQGIDLARIRQIEIIPAADSNERIPAVLLLDDPQTPAAALSAACPSCVFVRRPPGKPDPAAAGSHFPPPGGTAFPVPPAAGKP